MKKLIPLVLISLGALGTAHAAGDPKAGQEKAGTCAACHGMQGNSPANPLWPKQAGQSVEYFVKQLQDFKAGNREDPTMSPMAMPLSDEDILDLAAYYSSQEKTVGTVADAELAARGEKIYRGGIADKGVAACVSCHGPSGAGNAPARFPAISGQHAQYVAKTMKDFRDGNRSNDPQGMMRDVVAKMSDTEIEAVAAYVNALR